MKNEHGQWFVYVARRHSDLAVKIGYGADPCDRVQSIGHKHPCVLRAVFHAQTAAMARSIEKRAHAELDRFALGGEWFMATIHDAKSVISSIMKGEVPRAKGRAPHNRNPYARRSSQIAVDTRPQIR